jgi:ribonuclease Z
MAKDDKQDDKRGGVEQSRRDFLKGSAAAAGAGLTAAAVPGVSVGSTAECEPQNPYGDRPGGGVSLPKWFRPWPAIKNRNLYLPGTEILPKNEMRVTFLGSSPWPPNRLQKGTSILVELGNGTAFPRRFFFDLGNGSVGHALALQIPAPLINDIFISHLHADHFADLPYMYPFRAFTGGFKPLRVYGPSGRTPELGTKAMVKNMRKMNRWHEENFDSCPIGDGFEIEVHEFDWKERNGICYDKDGVKVRHWPRSHVKDGASAYRLDWEEAGLSFVWTGDGRPDELSAEFGKGADVFVSEGTLDTPELSAIKVGSDPTLWEYTIDIYHTMYYAAGYLFKKAQPRMAAICHFEWSGDQLAAESIAQVRSNWDGLFMFGLDLKVINVTKDLIWAREAVIGDEAAPASMDPRAFVEPGEPLPSAIEFPTPRFPREKQQEQFLRDLEIDPKLYYPSGAFRKPTVKWPGVKLDVRKMLKAKGIDPDEYKFK